jgi:hypothetical protein
MVTLANQSFQQSLTGVEFSKAKGRFRCVAGALVNSTKGGLGSIAGPGE